MADWDADIEIDLELARTLIFRQFPAFGPDPDLLPFGEGFDNCAFLVNGEMLFRFPRRKFAVQFLENEIRGLGLIAPQLSTAISNPQVVGQPSESYPYPFAGYPLIPGVSATRHPWSSERLRILASQVGRFLRELHQVKPFDGAPEDTLRRADLDYRLERLQSFAPRYPDLVQRAEEIARVTPLATEKVLVHGDLHPRHLIVSETGDLAGMIDWGDFHLGDAALDLSIAFTLFDKASRSEFWSAYGLAPPEQVERARFRAIWYAVILSDYAEETGDDEMAWVAARASRQVQS